MRRAIVLYISLELMNFLTGDNMNDKISLAEIGIICVTVIECFAILFLKVDGAILSGVVGAITGIVGYAFGVSRKGERVAEEDLE